MGILHTDACTNTNGTAITTHNAGWVVIDGAVDIQSNRAQGNSAGADGIAVWEGDTFDNHQYSRLTFKTDNSDGSVFGGCFVRGANAGGADGYSFYSNNGATTYVNRHDNDTRTILKSDGGTVNDGQEMMLVADGSTITCYINTSNQGAPSVATDSTYASGSPGFGFLGDGANAQVDDVEVGDFTTAVAIPVIESYLDSSSRVGGGTTNQVYTKPSGVVAGDLLVILALNKTDDLDDGTMAAPSGWTKEGESGSVGSDAHAALFWKEATGSEGVSETVVSDQASEYAGWYLRISGADTAAPIHKSLFSENSSANPHTISGVTTTLADCLLLAALAGDGGDTSPMALTGTGWSETAETKSDTSTSDVGCVFGEKPLATAGASGNVSVATTATDGGAYFQIAIAAFSPFNAQRQNILNSIDSAQSEGTGWDALFKAIDVSNVVRTSDTVVTITLPALATYDITAQEVITATVPNEALEVSTEDVVASPTFTIDTASAGAFQAAWARNANTLIQVGL